MAEPTAPANRRPRTRPPFRPVEVVATRRLAPRTVSVTLGGASLDGFRIEAPTQHIKVLFPPEGEREVVIPELGPSGPVWPEGLPRPAIRTYTPRRFNAGARTLEVEFVLHGEGPAATWAQQAAVGDRLAVAGPGGRLALELDDGPWLIAGDESALPAIGTLLDSLPGSASGRVIVEADSAGDEVSLPGPAGLAVLWVHRDGGEAGAALAVAVEAAAPGPDTKVWVACEALVVRRLRKALTATGVTADGLVTRGYWRAGHQDHPDHDYGED